MSSDEKYVRIICFQSPRSHPNQYTVSISKDRTDFGAYCGEKIFTTFSRTWPSGRGFYLWEARVGDKRSFHMFDEMPNSTLMANEKLKERAFEEGRRASRDRGIELISEPSYWK